MPSRLPLTALMLRRLLLILLLLALLFARVLRIAGLCIRLLRISHLPLLSPVEPAAIVVLQAALRNALKP
jgi:uncharacterized SAM-binding protein YcdF (DUF218 family)